MLTNLLGALYSFNLLHPLVFHSTEISCHFSSLLANYDCLQFTITITETILLVEINLWQSSMAAMLFVARNRSLSGDVFISLAFTLLMQTEAERRMREAGVIQWTEKRLRSCLYIYMYVCMYVCMYYVCISYVRMYVCFLWISRD